MIMSLHRNGCIVANFNLLKDLFCLMMNSPYNGLNILTMK